MSFEARLEVYDTLSSKLGLWGCLLFGAAPSVAQNDLKPRPWLSCKLTWRLMGS